MKTYQGAVVAHRFCFRDEGPRAVTALYFGWPAFRNHHFVIFGGGEWLGGGGHPPPIIFIPGTATASHHACICKLGPATPQTDTHTLSLSLHPTRICVGTADRGSGSGCGTHGNGRPTQCVACTVVGWGVRHCCSRGHTEYLRSAPVTHGNAGWPV